MERSYYVDDASDRLCEEPVQPYAGGFEGLGAKHEAEGVFEIPEEFEEGLRDIEGFCYRSRTIGSFPVP
jgi:hypothetical protein